MLRADQYVSIVDVLSGDEVGGRAPENIMVSIATLLPNVRLIDNILLKA